MLRKVSIVNENTFGFAPMEIIKLSSKGVDKGWFQKRASVLISKAAQLEPMEGHTAVYMVPMGSGEYYSSNRNADFWPETKCTKIARNGGLIKISSGLMERYPTFVTHGKVYKDHKNDDPEKSSGEIVLSEWNPDMHRIETVAFVHNDKWDKELDKIASEGDCTISMATDVENDKCSVCSNTASRPSEYCDHIKFYKNAILSDGHHVQMINDTPTFKDLSSVTVNADRLGYGLGIIDLGQSKTASVNYFDKEAKIAILKKLNEIEKQIDCGTLPDIGKKIKSVDPEISSNLGGNSVMIIKSVGPSDICSSLASKGGILSPEDFIETFMGDLPDIGNITEEIKSFLPNIFGDLSEITDKDNGEEICDKPIIDTDREVDDEKIKGIVEAIQPVLSVLPSDAEVRITVSKMEVPEDCIKGVIKKESKETYDELKKVAREYGKYVINSLYRMQREGLDPDFSLPVVRNRV